MRMRLLRECSSREMRSLLDEECRQWADELLWDFSDISASLTNGLDRGALTGRALLDGGVPVAYCYAFSEPGRCVVGSTFATRRARGRGLEEELLQAVVRDAQSRFGPRRVECQTLFSTASQPDRTLERAGFARLPRHYLVKSLLAPLPQYSSTWRLRTLCRGDLPMAARLIHRSHAGSPDAALNLTYAAPAQCQAFLETLVARAGCGPFEPAASFVAETRAGTPAGVVLGSRLSPGTGHICQVSVVPEAQGCGLGSALVIAALRRFRDAGLRSASLSVTVDNRRAYGIYEALGFELRRAFSAHAWVRPPARLRWPA
jgi:ribosomal protein S18 acetylase RimI-like enzyme